MYVKNRPYGGTMGAYGGTIAIGSGITAYNQSSKRQVYRSGQSGMTSRYNSRRRNNSGSLRTAIQAIKPAKHWTSESAFNTSANTLYSHSPTTLILQGNTNSTREGDQIRLEALKIRVTSHSAPASNAYVYRVIVGFSGEEYTPGSGYTTAGLTAAELFLPSTATLAPTNGMINSKAFTVLYDRTYDINSQVTGVADGYTYSDTVRIGQDFMYQSSGSSQGKTKNLFIVVTATVANGVSGVTATGDSVISYDLIFKE